MDNKWQSHAFFCSEKGHVLNIVHGGLVKQIGRQSIYTYMSIVITEPFLAPVVPHFSIPLATMADV